MLDIRFDLPRGQFDMRLDVRIELPVTGVFGPSGAGKTTLLEVLAGLVRPRSGRVALAGRVLFDSESKIDVPSHRRRVGVVFQDHRLFPHYTTAGNLRYGERLAPKGPRRFRFEEIVDLLELGSHLGHPVGCLSGGQQQRVALGRALLASPELLLLDEPFSALHQGLKHQILPFLQRIRRELNLPMLVVSHDLADILHLTDRLLLVDRGRVVGHGRLTELMQHPHTLRHFEHAGLVNTFTLRVNEHRPDEGVSLFAPLGDAQGESAGHGRMLLRGPHLPNAATGSLVHAVLGAEDVSLALTPIEGISIQNQCAATIRRLLQVDGRIVCQLDGDVSMLAEVTHQAVRELGLATGLRVWCLFKTHALRYTAVDQTSHKATASRSDVSGSRVGMNSWAT